MSGDMHACFCKGPQNGQPFCPCMMRTINVVDGRYVQPAVDHGPIAPARPDFHRCKCGAEHYAKPKFCSECGAAQ